MMTQAEALADSLVKAKRICDLVHAFPKTDPPIDLVATMLRLERVDGAVEAARDIANISGGGERRLVTIKVHPEE
jgi:hypothetical protein